MLRETRQSLRSGVRPAARAASSYTRQLSATTFPGEMFALMGNQPFSPASFMVEEFMLIPGAQMGGWGCCRGLWMYPISVSRSTLSSRSISQKRPFR